MFDRKALLAALMDNPARACCCVVVVDNLLTASPLRAALYMSMPACVFPPGDALSAMRIKGIAGAKRNETERPWLRSGKDGGRVFERTGPLMAFCHPVA